MVEIFLNYLHVKQVYILSISWPQASKHQNSLIAHSIRRFDILKKTGEADPSFNIPRKNQHSKWSPIKHINTKPTSKPISQKYILKKIGESDDDKYFGNMGFKFPKKGYKKRKTV